MPVLKNVFQVLMQLFSPHMGTLVFVIHDKTRSYIEKEDIRKLKHKRQERMQPNMGKMDIDYQVTKMHFSNIRPNQSSLHVVICNEFEELQETPLVWLKVLLLLGLYICR